MRRCLLVGVVVLPILGCPPAHAAVPMLRPPVYGAIERGFEPPAGAFGPGHRGIDFTAAPETQVVAAAPGKVTFAGPVAGTVAVTIRHEGGLETTYSSLSSVVVSKGEVVQAGSLIGTAEESHAGAGEGLHFGVKLHGEYVDPQPYLTEQDISEALHLAPVVWQPPNAAPPRAFWDGFRGPGSFASAAPDCERVEDPGVDPPAPNDNLVVEVAGIGSHTRGSISAAMYAAGAEQLGFSDRRIFPYSYRGARGVFMHEPYSVNDSFEDLDLAAARLRSLIERIGRLYPGKDVDVIAHSQGGIVARDFLTKYGGDAGLPRIDHFVTFSSPHSGAPFASNPPRLERFSLGRGVLAAIDGARNLGVGIPDPRSAAVRELAPGSTLMTALSQQDVELGTRTLALAIPDDPVVPADRAVWPGHYSRVVPPVLSANPHNAILSSGAARAVAYDFLRDGPPSCETSWDAFGPDAGRAIGFAESHVSDALRMLQFMLGL
ncbi:MAG: peptidoglycan DD-metalloendopeptidase family protein [Actinomycetota bacterium]|nr:peptidoglycan DD-metalloendopeptidase family protein [Actinomycetota bacterium]